MTQTAPERIASLDIVRGIAVMGILAMNILGFADVPAAYFNPLAQTAEVRSGDIAVWAGNFLLFDGKMRGLFSFLFGASLLMIAQRSGPGLGRRRLGWLLLFGLVHFFFIWWGDILIGYALLGFVALLFRNARPRTLIIVGVVLVTIQFALFSLMTWQAATLQAAVEGGRASADQLRSFEQMTRDTVFPSAAHRAEAIALYRGSWTGLVEHQFTEKLLFPLGGLLAFGWETVAYMLLGMAALKAGLLTGAWDAARYRRWALVCLALALPVYATALASLIRAEWDAGSIFTWIFAATVPVRPLMVVAYACLIILATRRGGALVARIAAAGRAAFSNYLGTSIVMTALFYGWGLGLYAKLGRIELALVVLAAWAVMLLWSKPWLERFRYGPLEWGWRSLTNRRAEPMRHSTTSLPA